MKTQVSWMVITSVTVLFLAGFGTGRWLWATVRVVAKVRTRLRSRGCLKAETAALLGKATWSPGSECIAVQVIGQQWKFTYRYPLSVGSSHHN